MNVNNYTQLTTLAPVVKFHAAPWPIERTGYDMYAILNFASSCPESKGAYKGDNDGREIKENYSSNFMQNKTHSCCNGKDNWYDNTFLDPRTQYDQQIISHYQTDVMGCTKENYNAGRPALGLNDVDNTWSYTARVL